VLLIYLVKEANGIGWQRSPEQELAD